MSTIDSTGIVIDRYDEVKIAIDTDAKSAFGDNVKLGADSVLGQLLAIIAERISDKNELIELVANLFNPNSASGVFLSQLVKLNGIERNESVYSTVSLSVTANNAGSTIPAGSTVSDPAVGEKFAIDSEVVLTSSETKSVSATAVNAGFIEAASNTLTKIDTPVYGWSSVTNPADASPGALEESDQELRARREIAARASGTASAAAVYTALLEVDGVDLAAVYENKTNATDSRGIPAHSIWSVVRGGTDNDIANVLLDKAPAGCGLYGSTTVSYADSVTGETYDIDFSRPTEVDIYIMVTLSKGSNYPSNGDDLIKEYIVDFFDGTFEINDSLIEPFGLGDNVVPSRLYSPVNAVPGHTISSILIGKTSYVLGSDSIDIDPDEIAGTDTSKIVIVG